MGNVSKRKDTNPKAGTSQYGNVTFADTTNHKYPLDNINHVKSAITYFSQADNAGKYSAADQKVIKARIRSAAKKFGVNTTI